MKSSASEPGLTAHFKNFALVFIIILPFHVHLRSTVQSSFSGKRTRFFSTIQNLIIIIMKIFIEETYFNIVVLIEGNKKTSGYYRGEKTMRLVMKY